MDFLDVNYFTDKIKFTQFPSVSQIFNEFYASQVFSDV